ncbi:MAG TPA: lasso peptide biosynthesis B2 protein [Allosphingosinicella sp.]|jgi:hypothetical protein
MKIPWTDVVLVLLAGALTLFKLKALPPRYWLRLAPAAKRACRCDDARLSQLAQRFDVMRPYLPGTSRCLPRSMLLLEFLRLKGEEAAWVFGVRTHPFSAHCWVQCGETVLNDTIDHVRWFTPIAVF